MSRRNVSELSAGAPASGSRPQPTAAPPDPGAGLGAVVVDSLVKRYGDNVAVNGVSFDVPSGEFATLLGPSGCGKTTTLRCVAGLEQVDGGTITIGNQLVGSRTSSVPSRKRGIGMVFQSLALWPHMTVAANVGYPLRMKRVPKGEIRERVARAVQQVGLHGLDERYPAQLSGGQQQRVSLARALVAEPAVILYDEPLSSLDAKLREQMREELRNLHDRLSISAIYVTHDQQEALELSDRLYVMHAGNIVQGGRPAHVYDHPASLFVGRFFGALNEFAVDRVDGDVATLKTGDVLRTAQPTAGTTPETVAIRPHRIALLPAAEARSTQDNLLSGTVSRAAVYGDRSRYTVVTERGTQIVVDAMPHGSMPQAGDAVCVRLASEHCLPMTA